MTSLKDFVNQHLNSEWITNMFPTEAMRRNVLKNMYLSSVNGFNKDLGEGEISNSTMGSPEIKDNHIEGHFVKWDSEDGHKDVTRKEALDEFVAYYNSDLNVRPIKLLYGHDTKTLAGYIGDVTEIKSDSYGAYFKATLNKEMKDYQIIKDLVRRGKLDVSYHLIGVEREFKDDHSVITKIDRIGEISLVTIGASAFTTANLTKSIGDVKESPEIESSDLVKELSEELKKQESDKELIKQLSQNLKI